MGKASSHDESIPTFCTPWPIRVSHRCRSTREMLQCIPGKNIAVRGRDGLLDAHRAWCNHGELVCWWTDLDDVDSPKVWGNECLGSAGFGRLLASRFMTTTVVD